MITKQFKKVESLPAGKYAMWWPTPEEPLFGDSHTGKTIQRTYEALDGFESYAFTLLLKALGEDVSDGRYALPGDSFVQPLEGPQQRLLAFSASQEKGLRLHFDILNTPASYRDETWQMFADFAEALRKVLINQGAVMDPPAEVKPLDWWQLCQEAVLVTESTGQTVNVVGAVVI